MPTMLGSKIRNHTRILILSVLRPFSAQFRLSNKPRNARPTQNVCFRLHSPRPSWYQCEGAGLDSYPVLLVGKLAKKEVLKLHAAWLALYSFLHIILTSVTAESKGEIGKMENDGASLIIEADDLFNQNKFSEIHELLHHLEESTTDVEVLWRISRALYNMAKTDKTSKRKELIRKAFVIVQRALDLDENHFAVHKWYAILLDENAALDGMKARVSLSMKFKEHMLKAIELNPNDATSHYVLGSWCFAFAELPWYQRKIAAALFATPPTSTYEEALLYFSKAEEVEPNFYSRNLLMLGKTYLRLEVMDKALHYLSITVLRPANTDDDHQANKEAGELLKRIKV